MIAYNHYIKFVPQLKNDKKIKGSFSNVVTVQENSIFELENKLSYELVFPKSQGRELALYSNKEFSSSQEEQIWVFEIKDVVTIFWHTGTLVLEYIKHKDFTEYLLKYWVLHVVLPTFFIIEGIYDFLHAGAVEIHEEPVLFIAKSFGGKSTMTDYFMKQGHTMISDDKVATFQKNGGLYAVPSYPHHRPYRNMEDLGPFVEHFAPIPKIMHVVYALEGIESDQEVGIELITGLEKFKSLRDAKEMNLFFHESKQLDYLAKIVPKLLVYRVSVPWNLQRLDEVYRAIVKHHSTIKGVGK